MSMVPKPGRLSKAELAREPRMLHVVAWFDGNARAHNPTSEGMGFPRRFTFDEAESWREGWMEGLAEKRCQDAHGFVPCPGEHWDGMLDDLIAESVAALRTIRDKVLDNVPVKRFD